MSMKPKRRPPEGNVRVVRSTGKNIISSITGPEGNMVQCESFGERCWLLRECRKKSVWRVVSQPDKHMYRDENGKERSYVPDFALDRDTGPGEIHEITRRWRRTREDMKRREEAGRREYEGKRGLLYLVHDEDDLPQGRELANLLALVRFEPPAYAKQLVIDAVREILGAGHDDYLRAVADQLARHLCVPIREVNGSLYHMLWHGELMTDLSLSVFRDGLLVPTVVVALAPWARA